MAKEKTTEQKAVEIVEFIKEAFCIDGDVRIVHKFQAYNSYIECTDSTRGIMRVSFSSSENEDGDIKAEEGES